MHTTGELAPLGYLHRESEFWYLPNGTFVNGDCGPNALAMAASYARQTLVSTQDVYHLMLTHGWCDTNGVSTLAQIGDAAAALGLTVAETRAYGEPWQGWDNFFGWHLSAQAGYHAIVLQIANGQALVDALSGLGENAQGLRYHFITVVARHPGGPSAYAGRDLPAGYWCLDGDNLAGGNDRSTGFRAADVPQLYPDGVLAAAQPCGAFAVVRAAAASAGGGTVAGADSGFYGLVTTADPQVWQCPSTGHTLAHGFKDFYATLKGNDGQTGTQMLGLPLSEEYGISGGRVAQDFERARLVFDASATAPWRIVCDTLGVQFSAAQADAQTAHTQLAAAMTHVAALEDEAQQLTAANRDLAAHNQQLVDQHTADAAALAQAQRQVAALQAQLAHVPPAGPPAGPPVGAAITLDELVTALQAMLAALVAAKRG